MPKIYYLQVILMPNGEILHQGKSLGYISNDTKYEHQPEKHLILFLDENIGKINPK